MAADEASTELSASKIKQIKECVGFFGIQGAASMCSLPVETISKIMSGGIVGVERSADPTSSQASRQSSGGSEKSSADKFERSESRSSTVERPPSSSPRKYFSPYTKPGWSSGKRKLKDLSPNRRTSSKRSPPSPRQAGGSKRPSFARSQTDDLYSGHIPISEDEDDLASEDGECNAISTESSGSCWVSSYMRGAADTTSSTNDSRGRLEGSYIFNAFKTLLRAKKTFLDTEHVVSIFVCNLMSSTQDIFLYPDHKFDENRDSTKTCLKTPVCLAITSSGCKFRPAFLLNHVNLSGRSLTAKRQMVHVQSRREWLETVFKPEMETNMIYNAICLTENADLYLDKETCGLLEQLNCEVIVVPSSLALNVSPFQHSILLALNGIMHDIYLNSNKQFPTNLNESLSFMEKAWDRLSAAEIRNAFNSTVMGTFNE